MADGPIGRGLVAAPSRSTACHDATATCAPDLTDSRGVGGRAVAMPNDAWWMIVHGPDRHVLVVVLPEPVILDRALGRTTG